MNAPSVLTVQVLAGMLNVAMNLTLTTSISIWKAAGWEPWTIGTAVTVATLTYAVFVSLGGKLADRWGRVSTIITGILTGLTGCLLAAFFPLPAVGLAAGLLVFFAGAFGFPGFAGIISDSGGDRGRPPPLHKKISGYNVGWSLGTMVGFGLFGLLSFLPQRAGYGVATVILLVIASVLWPKRRYIRKPPAPSGDRAGHPALAALTFMGRFNLLIACALALAMVSQLEKSLGGVVSPAAARGLTGLCLACYSAGYVVVFLLMGRWEGWIFSPWRLLLCQLGLPAGAAVFLLLALTGAPPATLAFGTFLIGTGYGSAYTASIYYSLRLPSGAAASAGLHETYIGAGNAIGPLLAGLFISLSGGASLASLGAFLLIVALSGSLFQAVMIPSIRGLRPK